MNARMKIFLILMGKKEATVCKLGEGIKAQDQLQDQLFFFYIKRREIAMDDYFNNNNQGYSNIFKRLQI